MTTLIFALPHILSAVLIVVGWMCCWRATWLLIGAVVAAVAGEGKQ